MSRTWQAMAVVAGAILGVAGIQGTGHADPLVDCNFTVTAAGNGLQAVLNHTPYLTLQTGEVFDLYKSGVNISTVDSNGVKWDTALGDDGASFPVRNVNTGTVFMQVDPNSCFVDDHR